MDILLRPHQQYAAAYLDDSSMIRGHLVLGGRPRLAAEGADGTSEGWTHRQPSQMSSSTL